jgi:hypothetical protein
MKADGTTEVGNPSIEGRGRRWTHDLNRVIYPYAMCCCHQEAMKADGTTEVGNPSVEGGRDEVVS